ncbi:MAG: Gfo/Idh/MocA family oxidoreductase [Planctomycetales bacterium]|nr:Gfo/Idh/MocA family oxidoreductase [Planctomycetales bacterium]
MKVGIVGIGFMGMIHYLTYQKVRGAQVAAICETIPKRLRGDWRDIKGNFGPQGTMMDLSGVSTYDNVDALLADESIDVVDITLPPGLHAPIAVKALQAGKHVFCEKPMSLTERDCKKMVAAAEKSGRLLMIGHVLPFFPEYAKAYELIQSGKYGQLLGGSFKRVISDPAWLPDYYKPDRVGGPMLDLHIHDAHYIRLLFGMPTGLTSQGRMRGDVVEYWNSLFRFSNEELSVSATSGVIRQQGRSFTHGFEIHLEKATLAYEFAVIGDQPTLMLPLTVFDDKGKATNPKIGDGDPLNAFEAELKAVKAGLASGNPSPILSCDLARDAITLCHKQTRAVQTGRPVRIL